MSVCSTNISRGTSSIALRTAWSLMPRRRRPSWKFNFSRVDCIRLADRALTTQIGSDSSEFRLSCVAGRGDGVLKRPYCYHFGENISAEIGDWMPTGNTTARKSVFLVEDEVMIRMMVSDMLEELGYSVAAEAGDIEEAVRLVQCTNFDIAILDVNVNGKVISPVAEAVELRNRPFVFATGYGVQGLPEKFRDRPALQKP